MKKFLEAGKIVTVHGIKGEVRIYPMCDSPDFLADFTELYTDEGKKRLKLESAKVHKNVVIAKISDCDTVEEARKLIGTVLYIDREDVELQDGTYFIADLIGLNVIDSEDGRSYGILSQVSPTGARDVYHIKRENGEEKLIPAIPQVVIETNIKEGYMKIKPLEGLFNDED